MQIDEYLTLYSNYRQAVERTLSTVALLEKKRGVSEDPLFRIDSREFEKKKRILKKATARMEAAVSRMGNTTLSNYIICKYFYNLKNTDIADIFSFCERHVYRVSALAKKCLYRELVLLMPKAKRWHKGKRFKLSKNRRCA